MTFRAPDVTREQLDVRAKFTAELEQSVRSEMGRIKEVFDRFNYDLEQIDPRLQLVRAAPQVAPGSPLKAGFYHLIRDNDNAPPSVITIEGPTGEFVEPSSALFDKLRENDLWNPEVMDRFRKRQDRIDQAAEKQKIREREERQDEIMERWAAATRTSVSMNRDTPWAQNAAGARRRSVK